MVIPQPELRTLYVIMEPTVGLRVFEDRMQEIKDRHYASQDILTAFLVDTQRMISEKAVKLDAKIDAKLEAAVRELQTEQTRMLGKVLEQIASAHVVQTQHLRDIEAFIHLSWWQRFRLWLKRGKNVS